MLLGNACPARATVILELKRGSFRSLRRTDAANVKLRRPFALEHAYNSWATARILGQLLALASASCFLSWKPVTMACPRTRTQKGPRFLFWKPLLSAWNSKSRHWRQFDSASASLILRSKLLASAPALAYYL